MRTSTEADTTRRLVNPRCGPVGMVGHMVSEGHDHDIFVCSLHDHTVLGVSRSHGTNLALRLFVVAHLNRTFAHNIAERSLGPDTEHRGECLGRVGRTKPAVLVGLQQICVTIR